LLLQGKIGFGKLSSKLNLGGFQSRDLAGELWAGSYRFALAEHVAKNSANHHSNYQRIYN